MSSLLVLKKKHTSFWVCYFEVDTWGRFASEMCPFWPMMGRKRTSGSDRLQKGPIVEEGSADTDHDDDDNKYVDDTGHDHEDDD